MRYRVLIILSFLWQVVLAQMHLPVIKATGNKASIRDGDFFDKDGWTLNPKLKPDTYTADRTRETKYVTFYTDIDSIRVKVKPGSHFDFVVLLNGRDSFYTRIESALKPEDLAIQPVAKPDTIPFWLTGHNAIAMKALLNGADTITMHFDLSGLGFRITKDAFQKKLRSQKPAEIRSLKIGSLTFQKPGVGTTELTARDMDGRIGWDVFENKIVEINYERSIMVVHPTLPNVKGYNRSRLHFIRSFPCLPAEMIAKGKSYKADFMMDTGAESSLIVDSTWVAENHFPTDLKIISTTVLHDPRGVKYEIRNAEIPGVKLNGFTTANVPALLLGSQHPTGFPINLLGNGLLKNFDMIVDFQKDEIYLKPTTNS